MATPQIDGDDACASFTLDVERKTVQDTSLKNDTVRTFAWQGVTVTVKDRGTKQPKAILSNIDGYVEAGKTHSLISLIHPLGSCS